VSGKARRGQILGNDEGSGRSLFLLFRADATYDAGMLSVRLRRPWRWLAVACLLLLLVAGVLFLFPETPDGSEEVLERVQLGMSTREVMNFLEAKKIRWAGYHVQPDGIMAEFRNNVVLLDFEEQKLVAKTRIRNRGAWYDVFLSYFHRIRGKLGI
jgi:hypothetical protein